MNVALLQDAATLKVAPSRKDVDEILHWICALGKRSPPKGSDTIISTYHIRALRCMLEKKWKTTQEREEIYHYIRRYTPEQVMDLLLAPQQYFLAELLQYFTKARQEELLYMCKFDGVSPIPKEMHFRDADAISRCLHSTPRKMLWAVRIDINRAHFKVSMEKWERETLYLLENFKRKSK